MSEAEMSQLLFTIGGGAAVIFAVMYPFFVLFKDIKYQILYGRCPDAVENTRHHIVFNGIDNMLQCSHCGAGFVPLTG